MKSGASYDETGVPRRIYANCIFAYNRRIGLFVLEYPDYYKSFSRIYNITSYKNETGLVISANPAWTDSETIIRNSIIYGNTGQDAGSRDAEVDAQTVYLATNSNIEYALVGSIPRWQYNSTYVVADSSFIQTSFAQCISQMTASRKSDHSLPDITFARLNDNNPLKEVGIQIPEGDNAGIMLSFDGTAPDIGYMQTGYEEGPANPSIAGDKKLRMINNKPSRSIDGNLLYYIK